MSAETETEEEPYVPDVNVAVPGPATGTSYEDPKNAPNPFDAVVEVPSGHARPEDLDPQVNGPYLDDIRAEQAQAYNEQRQEEAEVEPVEEEAYVPPTEPEEDPIVPPEGGYEPSVDPEPVDEETPVDEEPEPEPEPEPEVPETPVDETPKEPAKEETPEVEHH